MIRHAHAKVNLHLDIGPRRPDGYHSLKTVFQEISLHDTLRFTPQKKGIQLSVTPKIVTSNRDNLVVRALEMLQRKMGVKKGMNVHLIKRIPMGAGLGGGSSDAAAALIAGWLLWKRQKIQYQKVPPVLLACARKLGADVAFFLTGGTAWAEGIGEKLKPLPQQPRRCMVLVYPRVHVSTKVAYGLLDRSKRSTPSSTFFNSFEPVILKKFPAIARAKAALVKLGCTDVMMSGSGSTVFGFVQNRAQGKKVLGKLRHKPWDAHLVMTS